MAERAEKKLSTKLATQKLTKRKKTEFMGQET